MNKIINTIWFKALLILILGLVLYFVSQKKIWENEIKINKQDNEIQLQHLIVDANDNSPTVRWIKSIKDSIIHHLSPNFETAFLRIYGLKNSDLIGYTDYKVFPEATADRFLDGDWIAIDCWCDTTLVDRTFDSVHNDSIIWYSIKYPFLNENGDTMVAGEGRSEIINLD